MARSGGSSFDCFRWRQCAHAMADDIRCILRAKLSGAERWPRVVRGRDGEWRSDWTYMAESELDISPYAQHIPYGTVVCSNLQVSRRTALRRPGPTAI